MDYIDSVGGSEGFKQERIVKKGRILDVYGLEFLSGLIRRVSVWRLLTPQVESGYVAEGDHKTMAKAIKDRVSLIRRKREQRQLVREEQEKMLFNV